MNHIMHLHPTFLDQIRSGEKRSIARPFEKYKGFRVGDIITAFHEESYKIKDHLDLEIFSLCATDMDSLRDQSNIMRLSHEGFGLYPDMEEFVRSWDKIYGGTEYESGKNPKVVIIYFRQKEKKR